MITKTKPHFVVDDKTKQEEKKNDIWKYYLIFAGIIFAVCIISSAWSNAAHQDYLAHLTPEERKAISDQQIQEQQEKEINDKTYWENVNEILSGSFQIPMPIFLAMTFIIIWHMLNLFRRRW